MSGAKKTVTLIPGDGIGPECIQAAKKIIDASGVRLEWEERHAGASVFKQGVQSGVPQDTIDSIKRTRLVLKGPLETPIGFGEKSANVTLRKLFETYGNLRPIRELPGVKTPYSGRNLDLIVVRENVEDLYAGIEHMQTPGVAQCLKVISRKGCEKIVRLAFEVARAEGRKKVHCATKSNIMKLTEGFLKKTFEEVAKEYSDIEANHIIVDNCAHQLVKKPEQFDVIVTTNMNGDILSDLTSALVGGLGFAASANIGNDVAIFEAVHGSAPKYAGKNIINPIAVILSGVMMLRHLGEFEAANKIENAVAFTLEDGKERPRDICKEGETPTTTTKLTDTIIANFGKSASTYKARSYKGVKLPQISKAPDFVKAKSRRVVGMDVFVESALDTESLGNRLRSTTEASAFNLKMISSRGTKVFPSTGAITDTVDQFRCRFMLKKEGTASDAQCMELISQVAANFTWMHIEKLNEFDGVLGFTKAQGED